MVVALKGRAVLDLRYRLAGVGFLVASYGSALLHRDVYEAAKDGPAQLAELGLGLLTFLLASTGVLLIIHGSRLFKRAPTSAATARPSSRPVLVRGGTSDAEALDSRHGVAMVLARKAIAAAAVRDQGGLPAGRARVPDMAERQ